MPCPTLDSSLQAGLWGLSVLLPSAEDTLTSRSVGEGEDATFAVLESSLRVMEMFRANQTSVLVTTAAATRGLDFPQAAARGRAWVRVGGRGGGGGGG